jgi:hypothetical protein
MSKIVDGRINLKTVYKHDSKPEEYISKQAKQIELAFRANAKIRESTC